MSKPKSDRRLESNAAYIYMEKVRLGFLGMYDNTGFDEKK